MDKIKNKVPEYIFQFLKVINNKTIYNIKLDYFLQEKYKTIKQNIIFIFDIEFIEQKFKKTIFEIGGIIISKYINEWYLIASFHVNIKPYEQIKNQSLLTHYYSSVSNKNLKKVMELEKKILPHYKFESFFNKFVYLSYNNKLLELQKDNIINNYIRDKQKLLNETNKEKFLLILKKCIFKINGNNLLDKNLIKEFKIFKSINELIQKDANYRYIENISLFLKLLNKILYYSFVIVKGLEDFKAVNNHSNHYNIKFYNNVYFDIAIFNDYLFKKYKTAELKKSFDFLIEDNKIGDNIKYYNNMKKNYNAHNPFFDSLLTWLTFNIFYQD